MKLTAQDNPVFTLPNGDTIRHTRHNEVLAQIFVYHEPDQQWYVLLEHDTHTGQMNFPHGDLCWDETLHEAMYRVLWLSSGLYPPAQRMDPSSSHYHDFSCDQHGCPDVWNICSSPSQPDQVISLSYGSLSRWSAGHLPALSSGNSPERRAQWVKLCQSSDMPLVPLHASLLELINFQKSVIFDTAEHPEDHVDDTSAC